MQILGFAGFDIGAGGVKANPRSLEGLFIVGIESLRDIVVAKLSIDEVAGFQKVFKAEKPVIFAKLFVRNWKIKTIYIT